MTWLKDFALSAITAKESLSKITCIAGNVRAISQNDMFDPWLVPRGLLLCRQLLFEGRPNLFSQDLFKTQSVRTYCKSDLLDKLQVMLTLDKGTKKIQRTYTPSSLVTMVPNQSKIKPLARFRKLLRKEAMVNTSENCASC